MLPIVKRGSGSSYSAKTKELLPLIQKLSQTEAEATQITFVEDQVSSFTELIDRQITTLETLLTDWKVLNNNMIQIQKMLKKAHIQIVVYYKNISTKLKSK